MAGGYHSCRLRAALKNPGCSERLAASVSMLDVMTDYLKC